MEPPAATHTVFNQPPPRTGVNEFTANPVLAGMLTSVGGATDLSGLAEIGALVGSADFIRDARLANSVPPVLHTHDRYGHRIDEVEYHPGYHRILGAAVAAGAHTSAWVRPGPGANARRAAAFMLFAQVEPGHACPVSMTHAAVAPLLDSPGLADRWLPRLYSRSYAPALEDPKPGALLGMAMTEKQGGSDVRATATTARPADGHHLLTGHKWFCSAPMSDAFLVLAREEAGLSCFLLPRLLPDGARNVFRLQRLKDKLGNRANASAEVEFEDTVAFAVGEPGRGVHTIMGMAARTRLDCVLGTAAGMRQGVAEALWHTRHRSAFGRRLADQPAMAAVLADLALESEAATALGLRLARAHDDDAGAAERAFRRLATAAGKYWVCRRGPQHAFEALECLGGNGYTEDFPLAMRYREQPVLAIWEGAGNVIALDLLRTLAVAPDAGEAFAAELRTAAGANRIFDADAAETTALLRETAKEAPLAAAPGAGREAAGAPRALETAARRLAERLALSLQASLLIRYSPAAVSDAFVAARLGPERCLGYGSLPPSSDLNAILARH